MRFSALLILPFLGCASPSSAPDTTPAPAAPVAPQGPTTADAEAFTSEANGRLKDLWTDWSRAEWVMSTYITHDSEILSSKAHEDVLAYTADAIQKSAAFRDLELNPDTKRMLHRLRVSSALPAPTDTEKQKKLAAISSKLESLYGQGKYCKKEGDCKDLGELSKLIGESRDYDALLDAWQGWHSISRPMRPMYTELVNLANEGAREIGFGDTGQLWKSGYDMPADEFEATSEKLWTQVRPLYEQLHCYVRARLSKHYGEKRVPLTGMIPAHVLGNMWAQEWANIYPLVEPYKGKSSIDVTKALQKAKYDPLKMVRLAENFFVSLGLDKLPETFWERSMFTKPQDREVVCHASAWDVDYSGDLRIKMCIKVDEEDLITIHHELGHNYYFMYYNTLPALFQDGAHDGFHEAIGDAIALSVTPGYLKKVGLIDRVPEDKQALINLQLKDALEKIAFLPFGKLIDQWRWDVFSGRVKPEEYNAAWWKLRNQYQGVGAPLERTEQDFDPGAKYHIPAVVPYTRYFLARILQFQFHKAMCDLSGHQGALHSCSIFGNAEAGAKLKAMLALGASKPWPEALEILTGTREMNAQPLIDYFEPLMGWLREQTAGQKCGW